jgi:hypothetical protein
LCSIAPSGRNRAQKWELVERLTFDLEQATMKTYNFSIYKTEDGKLDLRDRFEGMLKYGISWPQDLFAEDAFTKMLQREVDQRSTLIRGFTLPDIDVTVPFILIGPPGIRVVLLTRERGIFRAKETQWLVHTGKGFKPAKDNLILRTQLYVNAVSKFFDQHGFQREVIKGLIVGVNPGMHVETHQSAVRVIQSDAIRRFGSQWVQEQPILNPEEIYQIVSKISQVSKPEIEGDMDKAPAEPRIDKFDQSMEPLKKTFAFNPTQWVIIGLLIATTVLVLLIFIIFILLSF